MNNQNVYTLLTTRGFLPLTINPTKVSNSSATVIDNIYSNFSHYQHSSGNILMTISEHFSQFFSVSRTKLDLKDINIYQRNYSNCDSNYFRDDISIQKWENNFADVNDFYKIFDSTVERHAPQTTSAKYSKPNRFQRNIVSWVIYEKKWCGIGMFTVLF